MPDISLITKTSTGEIHSIVIKNKDRLRAVGVSPESEAWVNWVDDSNATFDDVKNCLDFDLQNELPQHLTTKVLNDIDNLAGFAAAHNAFILSSSDSFLRIRQRSKNLGYRYLSRSAVLKDNVDDSAFYRPLSEFEDSVAAANLKAHRLNTETKYAAFVLQLKAVRAVFDPDIGPGGGWRCPEGTFNGGQITDRFGRGCGGLTRRLGRLLNGLPLGRAPSVPERGEPDERQVTRSRRALQRGAAREVRRNERSIGRDDRRTARQAGRVFDREQSAGTGVAEAFRRTPEYRRQRDEAVAAQVSRRRAVRADRRTRSNALVASSRLRRENRRFEVDDPRGEVVRRQRRQLNQQMNRFTGEDRRIEMLNRNEERYGRTPKPIQLELIRNRPWIDNPDWEPEIIQYLSDDDLRELINEIDLATPERYQRMSVAFRALEDGKLAFLETANRELADRSIGKRRTTVPVPKEFKDYTDAQLRFEVDNGKLMEKLYKEFGVFPSEESQKQWLKSIAARDILAKRRLDRSEQIRKIREEERETQQQKPRFSIENYSETLTQMSNRELAAEALKRHTPPIEGNDAQQQINDAIDAELYRRGLTSWTPNTIGRWADINPRNGRKNSSKLIPERVFTAEQEEILNHSLITENGLPEFAWWNQRSPSLFEVIDSFGNRSRTNDFGSNSSRLREQQERDRRRFEEVLRPALNNLYEGLYDDSSFLNSRGQYVNDRIRRDNERRRQVEDLGGPSFSPLDQDSIDQLIAEGRSFVGLDSEGDTNRRERAGERESSNLSMAAPRDSGERRQRRTRVSDAVIEDSNEMADQPKKRDYFVNEKRSLTDPVKTDVIDGRSLSQLEEVMRESETAFTFGRDPSGDFEAAEQFSRAYNTIAAEVRQAVRQLQAYENGEIGLSEEEANNLEKFLLNAKGVLDSELSGFNFGVDVDTRFQTPFGRNIDLGLAHPRFSNEDRAVFIEGRADFIAEAYEVSSDRNKSFAEKLRGVTEIFGRSSGQRRPSINDGDSAQDVQRQLREAGARSVGEPQMREFFRNEFGLNPQSVENIVRGLDEIQDTLRTSDSIDEQIRENTGLRGVDERIDTLNEFLRERHFALNGFFIGLLSERESPFVGESGNELLQAIRNMGIPEIFDGVNEEDLRSPNLWRALLQRMERSESDHYFNLSDYLSSFRYNFLNRNSNVDSVDRHKALVALADGRYTEVAEQVIDKSDLKLSDARKERLTESLAQSLQKIYPKGVNNESLINRIDQTAAMAGITDTMQPNVVLNESRQAMERRRNIVSLLGQKSQERLNKSVQAAKNRRRSALGSWLERNYGRWDSKPWSDYTNRFGDHAITPDEIDNIVAEYRNDKRLTAKVDDWIDRVYNIDYQLPNGAVLSSTVNSIYSGSGGLELDGTITLTLPDGTRRDVGEFSRVLGADSFYQSSASTVHNNVLAINDYDIETGEALSPLWKEDLIQQGIDPATKATTKGSGFATVFNQHAWNWLKDAGFTDISINAGLEDGGYVWGRMGFRPQTRDQVADFWEKVDKAVFDYEQVSDSGSSLVKTDLQAAMLKQLSQQARNSKYDPASSPAHMEMIMALETDSDNPKERKREIRDWIYNNNVQMSHGSISLMDQNLDPLNSASAAASPGGRGRRRQVSDPVTEQSDNMLDPVSGKSGVGSTIYDTPPKAMPKQLGLISSRVMDPGDVARPREIINPSIGNAADAVSFVRNGGPLGEVPNEFWPDVLEQNSSSDPDDANALFYSTPVNQGIGGWVSVYVAKNPDGTLSTSGWAVKNSAGRMSFARRWSNDDEVGRNHSAVFDVLGFNLAATAGLAPHGAGYAGTRKQTVTGLGEEFEVYVNSTILPLHLSVLPEGVSLEDVTFTDDLDFDGGIFSNAERMAIPQRLGMLVHSWALGVADRHSGNMASFVDKDRNGYVFPFDYGLLLERESGLEPETIKQYFENERVGYADDFLFKDAQYALAVASFDDRLLLRRKIRMTVDRMIDGYAAAIKDGFASFSNTAMAGFESTFERMLKDQPDSEDYFETLAANEKQRIIERLQSVYDSLEFIVDMRDEIKNQLTDLMSEE